MRSEQSRLITMVSKFVKYLLRKIISFTIIAILVIIINFVIPRLMPGNPYIAFLADMYKKGRQVQGGEEAYQAYIRRFGLDQPIYIQFVLYMQQILRGNLGVSLMSYPESVSTIIARAIPWTISLLTTVIIISWITGNVLGAFIGWSKSRRLNSVITLFGSPKPNSILYIRLGSPVYICVYFTNIPLRRSL
jgi:peptide/nickel transport system permease protein